MDVANVWVSQSQVRGRRDRENGVTYRVFPLVKFPPLISTRSDLKRANCASKNSSETSWFCGNKIYVPVYLSYC